MTGSLVVFCKKIIVHAITFSGQIMNSMVEAMQIIMDAMHIFFMLRYKKSQTNMRNHVLNNMNELVLSGGND